MTTLPDGVTFRLNKQPVLSGEIEQLVTTTETPGGYNTCTFSSCSQVRPERTAPVVIFDSTHQRWPFIGRVSSVHRNGLTYDVTATRSTRDRTYTVNTVPADAVHPSGLTSERIYKAGQPLLTALTDAFSIGGTEVFQGTIQSIADQFVADSNDLGGQTMEQVWDYISSILGSLDTPLLWHIRGRNGLQVADIEYQDIAPRYFTRLSEDQIEETYDDTVICNEVAIAFGHGQIAVWPPLRDYSVIKTTHTKYINAQNTVTSYAQALALAQSLFTRLNTDRTVNDVLTIDCNKNPVRIVPPLVTVPDDNWPLWLVESGHGIELLGRPSGLIREKYITGTEYNWDEGKLTCRCGEVSTIESKTNGIVDYNVNRLFNGPYNGPTGLNQPLADADLLPKVGGEIDGASPPATSYGIPAMKATVPGEENNKYKKAIDPEIIADEGLSANIVFDPSTVGFQAAIQVVPGTFNTYRLLLGNSSGLVADTVMAQLHKVIPPSKGGGTQLLCTVSSAGAKDTDQQPISPPVILGRRDYYMIKVTTAGTTATWAALSLHAKKNYPGLK